MGLTHLTERRPYPKIEDINSVSELPIIKKITLLG